MSHTQLKYALSTKVAVVGLIGLAVIFGEVKLEQYKNQRAVEQEKQKLLEQANSLEKRNKELSDSLSFMNSDSFKERVARQQLNLKKDGEQVYTFTEASPVKTEAVAVPSLDTRTNPQKWWNYFFKVN